MVLVGVFFLMKSDVDLVAFVPSELKIPFCFGGIL
jgi:hypothetical protein